MEHDRLELIEPIASLRDEYVALTEDYLAAGEEQYRERRDRAQGDFAGLLRQWQEMARGVNLGPDQVQQQTWWLVRNGREILGTVYLRPEADAERQRRTGHVGMYIRPNRRGRGYGTAGLRMALQKLQAAGVTSVAIVTRRDNLASRRVFEKCNARLEGERFSEKLNTVLCIYRIDLPAAASPLPGPAQEVQP